MADRLWEQRKESQQQQDIGPKRLLSSVAKPSSKEICVICVICGGVLIEPADYLSFVVMDPNVRRFTGYADVYDKFRPALPTVIRDILIQLAGAPPTLTVVDLGAGTGLSTRLWRGIDATVIGIEPSPDMRKQAELNEQESRISFREGTSTQTGLPESSTHIVTVSQALHWMEPDSTFQEVFRILRPGGVFAAIDCDWPPTIHPKLDLAYSTCMKAAERAEKKYAFAKDVRRWDKNGHLARMRAGGRFEFTKEICCHSVEFGQAERLVGLARSQGGVATLLQQGVSEEEIGLNALSRLSKDLLGDRTLPWLWSYRLRIGIKGPLG